MMPMTEIDNEVANLLEQKKQLQTDIYTAEDTIRESKEKIKGIEKKLYKKCKHIWQYDYSCAFDDHTKHFCSICGVWKNAYWYE